MNGVFVVVESLCGLTVALSLLYIWRLRRVLRYRLATLNAVSEAAQQDIASGLPWRWRYDVYETVTFDQMAYSARPLKTFYEDKAFLSPSAVDPNVFTSST